jgi:hypothetical protein
MEGSVKIGAYERRALEKSRKMLEDSTTLWPMDDEPFLWREKRELPMSGAIGLLGMGRWRNDEFEWNLREEELRGRKKSM